MKNKILNFFKSKNNLASQTEKVVTRIAPSPTGVMHIGTARTALFNYLFAKKNNGKFIFRIEDTDTERSKPEYEKDILDGINFLGLKFDSFYRQSERKKIYEKYLNKLIKEDYAYFSKETEGDRKEVIRFRNPGKKIAFQDLIRGEISFDTTELGDFVIAKSISEPLYHLAVVIDDFEMRVTHIIRGEDGISNTPRQILIQEALGIKIPHYAHLPLILGKDRAKLSKRHGAVSLSEFQKNGYLPEAIINHLALLGWNPGTDQELFTLNELTKEFSLEKVSKSGSIFNEEKLKWFNKIYLKNISDESYLEKIHGKLDQYNPTKEQLLKLKEIILERIENFSEISSMVSAGELEYFFVKIDYPKENLIWKKSDASETLIHLNKAKEVLSIEGREELSEKDAKDLLWYYAEEKGKGHVLWPLRYALSGKDKSPDPFVLISILGKKESLERIQIALNKLNDKKS